MRFYLIVKDEFTTQFMQAADVFEPFKFAGSVLAYQSSNADVLTNARKLIGKSHSGKQTVGLVVEGGDAVFSSSHKVFSDGSKWSTVEELSNYLGAANAVEWVN